MTQKASRAARRRIAREVAKLAKRKDPTPSERAAEREDEWVPGTQIRLENPVRGNFESFIFGNATMCNEVVKKGSAQGQHIVICGAGPSLRDHAADWVGQADQVWGCNSAATWLHDEGLNVTHGFAIDQTPHMVAEWQSAPPIDYLLASTVHPHLTEYLQGKGRRCVFFHNFVGLKDRPPVKFEGRMMSYEDWMYTALYDVTVRVGSGLNSVTRAIDVATFMGAGRITVLGADHAMRAKRRPPDAPDGSPEHHRWLTEDVELHANGDHALASGATPVTLEAEIDGKYWVTKPDMVISAVWLADMAKHYAQDPAYPALEIVGDVLPAAIMTKPKWWIDRLPTLMDGDGNAIRYVPAALEVMDAGDD